MTHVLTTISAVALALAAGWVSWTFTAYALHRFAMHLPGGRGIMSREHLQHHTDPVWTVSARNLVPWAGVLIVGVVMLAPPAWFLAGTAAAVAAPIGWVIGYASYFYMHRGAHLSGPRTRRQAFVIKLHLEHHFRAPTRNHGFNVLIWDRCFGTFDAPEQVRVPRRLAPPWLIGGDGDVLPEFATDYVLVGAPDASSRRATLHQARALAPPSRAD